MTISPDSIEIPEDYRLMELEPGNKIDLAYETKPTPLMIKKLALAVLTSFAMFCVYSSLGMYPLFPITAGFITVVLSYQLYKISYEIDYDHPKTREKIINQIANLSLCKVLEQHPSEKIHSYALLKNCPIKVYNEFEKLATLYQRAKTEFLINKGKIDTEYQKNLTGFRVRRDHLNTQWYFLHSDRDQEGRRSGLNCLLLIINLFQSCNAHNHLRDAEDVYGQERLQKLIPFERTFRNTCDKLNNDFDKVRSKV